MKVKNPKLLLLLRLLVRLWIYEWMNEWMGALTSTVSEVCCSCSCSSMVSRILQTLWKSPPQLPKAVNEWTEGECIVKKVRSHKAQQLQHKFITGENKGVCHHIVALPFTLKRVLRQMKKNYGNSNISPCKNIPNLQKNSSKRNQNPSTYHNSITNLKFQHKPKKKSTFKNPHIKINRPIIIIIIIIT
jgi:hypothetical protein